LDSARALQADVKRRVHAGDLAPVDLALAHADTLAAEAAFMDSQAQLDSASLDLKRLTGSVKVGALMEATAVPVLTSAHPALQVAREAVSVAQNRLELLVRTRRDNPRISAAARFDRDVTGAPYRNTFRIGMSIPLDTEARNAPLLAAATAALTEAEVALEQRERELEAEVGRTRLALISHQALAQNQEDRSRAAQEVKGAIERAFYAGERSLAELLRVRSLAFEAELAHQAAIHLVGLSQARLLQAMGVEP
jgi:outer membrane protein TolC